MCRRLTAAAAIFGFLVTQPAAAELACNPPAELAALQFRQFQAILNVAALKCEGSGFDYAGGYNAFVERTRPALEDNAHRLAALFTRMGRSPDYIDHYATELFNQVQGGSQLLPDQRQPDGQGRRHQHGRLGRAGRRNRRIPLWRPCLPDPLGG